MDTLHPHGPDASRVRQIGARLGKWWLVKMLGTSLGMAVFFVLYFWVLENPRYPVVTMPLTAIDRIVAFRPGAVFLYISLWVYVSLAPALMIERRDLAVYTLSAVALSGIGLGIFYFWPTTVPPLEVEWPADSAFAFLKSVDATGNACPSLHVAFAVFTAAWIGRLLRQIRAGRLVHLLNLLWCTSILYSTLATRQHVALDVLAGALLGGLIVWAALAWLSVSPETTKG